MAYVCKQQDNKTLQIKFNRRRNVESIRKLRCILQCTIIIIYIFFFF
jgi:hypothetical protein